MFYINSLTPQNKTIIDWVHQLTDITKKGYYHHMQFGNHSQLFDQAMDLLDQLPSAGLLGYLKVGFLAFIGSATVEKISDTGLKWKGVSLIKLQQHL